MASAADSIIVLPDWNVPLPVTPGQINSLSGATRQAGCQAGCSDILPGGLQRFCVLCRAGERLSYPSAEPSSSGLKSEFVADAAGTDPNTVGSPTPISLRNKGGQPVHVDGIVTGA
jgi:hypothetical protein